jgi:hypothetical protein
LGAVVEVVLLSAVDDELHFRVRRADQRDAAPDSVARSLAGLTGPALLHSTSWRYERRRIVLTYVALPDRPGTAATAPVRSPIASSLDPLRPAPAAVRPDEVAAHACRHLAFLSATDPVVRQVASELPELWELIDAFEPAVAGVLASNAS